MNPLAADLDQVLAHTDGFGEELPGQQLEEPGHRYFQRYGHYRGKKPTSRALEPPSFFLQPCVNGF